MEAHTAKSAIAGGRHYEDIQAIYLASFSCTHVCDVDFKNCESKCELEHENHDKGHRHTVAGWRMEAYSAKSAIVGG